jgi:single-strand DNA-binding protein
MAGVNKVILIGHLGRDPDVRRTQDGRPIASLSVATSESWRDKATGERKEKTEWHRVVIFNEKLAELAEQYLKKGAKVYFEGKLRTRKWTDQGGVDKYTTEVVLENFDGSLQMLDGRREGGPPAADENSYGERRDSGTGAAGAGGDRPGVAPRGGALPRNGSGGITSGVRNSDMDDDIPF